MMNEKQVDVGLVRLAQKLHRGIYQTFLNRGLYQRLKDGRTREVQWLYWLPDLDRRALAFIMDTGTLPASIEKLTDPRVVHQISTMLGGRRVHVTNHRGVAWVVGMDLPPLEEQGTGNGEQEEAGGLVP
jgi:hypothetical protein